MLDERIRVYWPLDKKWYEGRVTSYDKTSRKHSVLYDDGEEELLELGEEKIEWIQGDSEKKFKRLRRGSSMFNRVVIEDEEMEDVQKEEDKSDGDDSSDEDWGKNMEKEVSEDAEEDDVVLEDEKDEDNEEEEAEEMQEILKGKSSGKIKSRKRKTSRGGKPESGKKSKSIGDVGKGNFKVSVIEPVKITESKSCSMFGYQFFPSSDLII